MNKCMCASIISLHRLKLCSRNDMHCSILSSCPPLPWALIRPLMHTNIRRQWLLFFVVMQFDLREPQIKFSLDVSVSVFNVRFTSAAAADTVSPSIYHTLKCI